MRELKNLFLLNMLVIGCIISTNAQVTKENNVLTPAIRDGGYGVASKHSGKHELFVFHLMASKHLQNDMDELAETLHTKYESSDRKYPTNVVIFKEVVPGMEAIVGSMLMHGDGFKLPSGTSHFSKKTLESDKAAEIFLKYYYVNYIATTFAQVAKIKDTVGDTNGSAVSEVTKNNILTPAIRDGRYGEAQTHSIEHKMFVVHLMVPKHLQNDMDRLAEDIHTKYESPDRKYPTDVVIFKEIVPGVNGVTGSILMNGITFKLPSGKTVFPKNILESDKAADTFLKYYHVKFGMK